MFTERELSLIHQAVEFHMMYREWINGKVPESYTAELKALDEKLWEMRPDLKAIRDRMKAPKSLMIPFSS